MRYVFKTCFFIKSKLICFLVLFIVLLFTACNPFFYYEPEKRQLKDNRFNGRFENLGNNSGYFLFNGTNQLCVYDDNTFWSQYGNLREIDIDIDKGLIRMRKWDNRANWSEWASYRFYPNLSLLVIEIDSIENSTLNLLYSVEKEESFILNTKSKVAHKSFCGIASRIQNKNKRFSRSIPAGYSRCGNCFR